MDRVTARTLLRDYILEPKEGNFSDRVLNTLLVHSNNQVYSDIVSASPDRFVRSTRLTYPANAEFLDMSTALKPDGAALGKWTSIQSLQKLSSDADVSATNHPTNIEPVSHIADLYKDDLIAPSRAHNIVKRRFFIAGRLLHLYPIPKEPVYLLIKYIPVVKEPSSDSDKLLELEMGATDVVDLEEHHELVVLLATIRAKTIAGDPADGFVNLYNSRKKSTIGALQVSQQRQTPATIRRMS